MLHDFLTSVLAVATTLGVWRATVNVYRRHGHPLTNPVFLSVGALIAGLVLGHIDYADYARGGHWLSAMLKPAVVAFAVPLYRQRERIRRNVFYTHHA